MSPKKRNPENKGLPPRWRQRYGAYYYMVPKGMEHRWDGKKEFKLGRTLSEAHIEWAKRVESAGDVTTMADLFARYAHEVIPTKKPSTQRGQADIITKLSKVFGEMRPGDIKPTHAYAYFDKRSAKTAAKREIELLRHALSMAVRWGVIDNNPLLGQLKLEVKQKQQGYITDDQVLTVLSLKPTAGVAVVQGYIRLKLLTGLRRTDMLRLTMSDVDSRGDGITVATSKTGKGLIIEWTDELRSAVKACRDARPVELSPWLFCTRRGQPYIKDDATANGWESLWQRVMSKEGVERFPERALRNKCATDAESLEHAKALLAHADGRTTERFYRLGPTKVKPLR